jgi:hypothetical protein
MANVAQREVDRWMLMGTPDDGPMMVILVVDDSDDDDLTAAIAREGMVPADHFSGLWGTGEHDGFYLIAFRLIELGGGIEREFFTDNVHRELLDAILVVPHLVAIMPREIAGDAKDPESIAHRLGGAMIVEVQERSPQVAKVRAERDD